MSDHDPPVGHVTACTQAFDAGHATGLLQALARLEVEAATRSLREDQKPGFYHAQCLLRALARETVAEGP